jgi:hypothetical protein
MSYDLQVLAENRDALPLEEVVAAFKQGLGDDLVAVVLFGSRALARKNLQAIPLAERYVAGRLAGADGYFGQGT